MSGFATARQKMVDGQVRPSDVTDIRILDAMQVVPREAFVPEDRRALAYLDLDLDISAAGGTKRFLVRPRVIAKMLQAAEITGSDNVLIAGCASGYTAALAAQLAARVAATEPGPEEASRAKAVLAELGLANVTFRPASAAEGDPANGPYDLIILDGATEITPDRLYQQLKDGGRLIGVFAATKPPRAVVVSRSHSTDFGQRALFDATVPVLPGLERLPEFVF
jgi:protein-L-isoaspartate(D-aspartate) O-methyltransferase